MTIFGNTSLEFDGKHLIHERTKGDAAANYIFGIVLIIIIPPGLILNLLVYIKNHLNPQTPASVMYRCLAVVDFLVCSIRGLQQVVALLSPVQQEFYDDSNPNILTKIIAVITLSSGVCMMTTVTLLSCIRLVYLACPFLSRQYTDEIKYVVIATVSGTAIVSLTIAIHYISHKNVYWMSVTQWIVPRHNERAKIIIDLIIPLVSMTITTIASIVTITYLVYTGDRTRRRGSLTVLLMSSALILWNVMLFGTAPLLPLTKDKMPKFLEEGKYEVYYIYYMVTCFFPIVLTVYNSLIIVCRSTEIKRMIRERALKVYVHFQSNYLPSTNNTESTPIIQSASS